MATWLDLINNTKESAAFFLLKAIEFYGSPDPDENVELTTKCETLIHTFDGMVKIEKLVSRYNYDDGSTNEQPELQIVADDFDFHLNHVRYTIYQLPIEGIIELCIRISEQYGFADMFNELFSTITTEE